MAADLWMPGVERHDTGRRLRMQGQHGVKLFTWHTFEAPYSLTMNNAWRYLRSQKSDPHFVFHPRTGELVQMLPANTGGRTLRASGASTNTWGSVHMQVEVIAYAKNPWTSDLTPAGKATLARLLDYLRSWGIPDQWCHGVRPPKYPGGSVRRRQPTQSGHFHHAGWVANDHGDPGAIANPWSIAPPAVPQPEQPTQPDPEEFDMSAEQYATLKKQQDEILNVLNHHIRGDLTAEQKKNLGTSRNLPLRDVIALTGGRVNSIRARQWDVIEATDAVVKALKARGVTVNADAVAAIQAALTEKEA